jgi:hypothetical protein
MGNEKRFFEERQESGFANRVLQAHRLPVSKKRGFLMNATVAMNEPAKPEADAWI